MGLPTIAVPEYTLKIPSTGEEVKYRPFLVKEETILDRIDRKLKERR